MSRRPRHHAPDKRRVEHEAAQDLIRVNNGYRALLPYLAKFEMEMKTKGRLSEDSQVLIKECVRSLHKLDRFAERLFK